MKTPLKYLAIVALAIAALTWPLFKLTSTKADPIEITAKEEKPVPDTDTSEDITPRATYRRMQLEDENGEIPPDAWNSAYAEKEAMPFLPDAWSEFLEPGGQGILRPWLSIGPGNVGGRIRSIIIHPTNPAIIWVGGVSGGIWKTTNGGMTSWSTNTDLQANLAVNCMAIDPANPLILYAGTGEGFNNGDAVQGNGIFKTTDGGDHWTQLDSTAVTATKMDFAYVNRLAVCPTNSQLLLATTTSGIFRSTDGGNLWSRSTGYDGLLNWVDVRFKPIGIAVPDIAIPTINCLAANLFGGLYYSTDNGATWATYAGNGLPSPSGLRRIELAYSRSNPLIVYVSTAAIPNDPSKLFYSDDGGYTFSSLGHPYVSAPTVPGGPPGASSYTNALWVDPTNPDTVVVGGVFLLRTTDRGAHWEEAYRGSHLDHHVLVEDPGYTGASGNNRIVYCGNDGGIYRTDDILANVTPTPPPGGSVLWTSLNHTLGVTQFYGGAGNAMTGKIIGGSQDNGTLRYEGNAEDWHVLLGSLGGDGGFCASDQVPESEQPYFYGEFTNLEIYRSTGAAINKEYIWYGIPHPPACGGLPCALFAAPFVLDPNNRERILGGARSLWRTNNARQPIALEVSWTEIKSELTDASDISAIAVADGNPDLIWVGYHDGTVSYTINGTRPGPSPSPTPTWTSGDIPPQNRMCTRITIGHAPQTNDPPVARVVYVTFGGFRSGNVWKRENDGTWRNLHDDFNLPKIPVYSLVISPSNPNVLYIGTELGVFASGDDGMTWSPRNGGPANTQVAELFWMGTKLIAVTHGRGMFTLEPPTN